MWIRYDEILTAKDISTYIRPFSKRLWWVILASTVLIAASTIILVHKSVSDFGLVSACYHSLDALTNQGKP